MQKAQIDIKPWQQQLVEQNTRGVLFTTLTANQFVATATDAENNQKCLLLNSERLSNLNTSRKSAPFLGKEYQLIDIDSSDSFDVNMITALLGTLTGGGIMQVRLNNSWLATLSLCIEHLNAPLASHETGYLGSLISKTHASPCLKRFMTFSLLHKAGALLTESSGYFPQPEHHTNGKQIQPLREKAIQDQAQLVEKIIRVAKGHGRRPLVINADRGRGKSAALGLAAKRLLKAGNIRILVTAPEFSNLASLYKHLDMQTENKGQISVNETTQLTYLAPDRIIEQLPDANLLIIDEAAALPVSILQQLTAHYSRIVFSTTVHGYEGNGKGFDIRFKQALIKARPQTRFAKLSMPMRWSLGDPLEQATNQSFLLDSDLSNIEKVENIESLRFNLVDQSILTGDQDSLQQIFALLVNAHYQTRPADLERLLTSESQKVAVLSNPQAQIVAVCLINQEGQLEQAECDEIIRGDKRLKGELLPQSIILNHGISDAGRKRYYRVMRIAVHPDLQNQGIGSKLLKDIENLAIKSSIDFIGASFSAEPQVVRFWLKNQFKLIRFGSSKDSSSGNYSCEVLTVPSYSNQSASGMLALLESRLARMLPYHLRKSWRALDSLIILDYFKMAKPDEQIVSHEDRQLLSLYASGKCPLSNIDYLLPDILPRLIHRSGKTGIADDDWLLLVDIAIRQLPHSVISKQYDFKGAKAINRHLRKLIRVILGQLD